MLLVHRNGRASPGCSIYNHVIPHRCSPPRPTRGTPPTHSSRPQAATAAARPTGPTTITSSRKQKKTAPFSSHCMHAQASSARRLIAAHAMQSARNAAGEGGGARARKSRSNTHTHTCRQFAVDVRVCGGRTDKEGAAPWPQRAIALLGPFRHAAEPEDIGQDMAPQPPR